MDLLKGGKPPSEAFFTVTAKEKTASRTPSTPDTQQRPASVSKMAYARRAILVLLCTLVLLGVASASPRLPCHKGATDHQAAAESSEPSSFSALLKSASPSSLHELLHRYLPDRFQDGVWPSEHQAVEAVHQADAALATSIVQLAKRDGTNSTTSSVSSSPEPTESSSSTSPTGTSTSTDVTVTSSEPEPTSTSSMPPVTTSSSSTPTTSTTSSSLPGTSLSLTETSLSLSSSPSPSSFESGTPPSTASHTPESSLTIGTTTLTTSTVPSVTTSSSTRTSRAIVQTLTSTSPNGAVVVVTATTFVPADGGQTQAPASTTTRSNPSLQNYAAPHRSGGSVLAGAVAFVMVLLVL